jgi:3-hydroxyisobutyrate dehydrogenase-like beta-hydroxyacid dehydrogenase
MGAPMAANLHAAGFELHVWNRTRAKAEAFARAHPGATVHDTPQAAAEPSDVAVSIVANDDAAWAVHAGPDGILSARSVPPLVLECGTIGPTTVKAVATQANLCGTAFLDAPVSGSIDAASKATLLFMVGGAEHAVQAARPLFDALGAGHVHFGESGNGAMVKLLVNGVLHTYGGAVSESLSLAQAAGIDVTRLYTFLARSAAGAPMLGYRQNQYLNEDAPVTFTLDLADKDVTLLRDEAQKLGVSTEHFNAHHRILRAACDAGYGSNDMADVWRFLSEVKGDT